ncbi:hypothetical protein HMPREF0322_03299 [Desulfitobacterium hafniense DP7]|uniref:Uncharacterized protein n=1 Tax=Desulfitobacterium hafniense DP7 TaxID=537010 RepID=G9XQQ1_DESHA|nr:hypothetical protein HMPREF0322_03299 [Desulfitobacterium hafniense DP7]
MYYSILIYKTAYRYILFIFLPRSFSPPLFFTKGWIIANFL